MSDDDGSYEMMPDDGSYSIVPSDEEVRREAVGKLVECSILKDRVADMENDINNLRYLIELLDETAPSKDDDGRVDIRPVYKEIRARIMDIMCRQMELEQHIDALTKEMGDNDALSNVKVVVKKL